MGGPSGPSFLIYRDIHTILLSFTAIPPSASYLGSSLQREPDPLKGSITFAVQLCYSPQGVSTKSFCPQRRRFTRRKRQHRVVFPSSRSVLPPKGDRWRGVSVKTRKSSADTRKGPNQVRAAYWCTQAVLIGPLTQ